MEKLLTTGEVAERLGVHETSVSSWAKDGRFPNAQRVGKQRIWIIPESDLEELKRNPPDTRRKRLTPAEYEAYGLEVVAHWKRVPPILRCPSCGRQWRSWEWQCPSGCNAGAKPPPGQIANPELREARKRAGLTQGDVARVVGVSRMAVSQWEMRGTQPREPRVRQQVIDLLGLDTWPQENTPASRSSEGGTNEALRNAREAASWTYAELAQLVGVAPSTVLGWEQKGRTPRTTTRLKVAALLGFDPWVGKA